MKLQLPPRPTRALFALGAFLLINPVSAQPTNAARSVEELRDQLEEHITDPRFNHALWGVKVLSLDTGRVLFAHEAERLMSPASNSKLYVGALALDALGGDYQIRTPVLATRRPDARGVVAGDVVVAGRGDPGWKLAAGRTNFWELFEPFIAVLTNAGVRHIQGQVIADASWFQSPPNGAGWTAGDLEEAEGAEISAITLLQNLAQLRALPGPRPGDPARLELLQPHTGLRIDNRAVTLTNGEAFLEVRRVFGEDVLRVFGGLPAGTNLVVDVPVPRPAQWFAAGLKAALERRGIRVDGSAASLRWPEPASSAKLVPLGEVVSAPMRELVRAFMKPSQNLETDLIFGHVGELRRTAATPAWRTTEQLAVDALEAFVRTNGLPVGDLKFEEGSGLSRNNLVTANLTAGLVQVMARHREAKNFLEALPVAGVDGTLRRRMKGTPAEGNVRAKTGTLRWVNALSGQVTSAAGERLAFSLFLNRNVAAPGRSGRDELDAVAVKLASFAGRSDTTQADVFAPLGRLVVTQLVNAPFPHPSRAAGHTYGGRFYPAQRHYTDNTVAFFVPKNFRADKPFAVIVHFHGWGNSVAGTLGEFSLVEQLAASGRNVLLIVPEGPRLAPDSGGGKLEEADGFQRFMVETTGVLSGLGVLPPGAPVPPHLILSGHSGGYKVMSAIVARGGLPLQVREAWLFDGLYGGTEAFLDWQQKHQGRLLNIYTDTGGTRKETERALEILRARGTPAAIAEHATLADEALRAGGVLFIHSDRSHSGVIHERETFRRFIETSGAFAR